MPYFHYDIVNVNIKNLSIDLVKTAIRQKKFNVEKVPVDLNKAIRKLQKELNEIPSGTL